MRPLALATAIVLAGCQPHVDFRLSMQCAAIAGNPPPPTSCDQMTLGCANFLDFRVYSSDANGTLGTILESNCLPADKFGMPANLCALLAPHAPIPLLSSLPSGKTVRFRIRAMVVANPAFQCNDDVPGEPAPVIVFDGFSAAATLDGGDHVVPIPIGFCGSCGNLPNGMQTLSPACVDSGNPNGARCCMGTPAANCRSPNDTCPDGSKPELPPGGCCAICPG
jgi:hypothetical protein